MTDDGRMVVVDGVRYRAEDAKRLGLEPAPEASDDTSKQKSRRVPNKARKPSNKGD